MNNFLTSGEAKMSSGSLFSGCAGDAAPYTKNQQHISIEHNETIYA